MAFYDTQMSEGSRGANVVALQKYLATRGCNSGAADGDFGPATKRAVQCFQRQAGLTDDGVVGPDTLSAIRSDLGGSASSPPPASAVQAFQTPAASAPSVSAPSFFPSSAQSTPAASSGSASGGSSKMTLYAAVGGGGLLLLLLAGGKKKGSLAGTRAKSRRRRRG